MNEATLQELYQRFCRAEIKIKSMEHGGLEPLVPAVNELRYAAFHLLLAMKLDKQFGTPVTATEEAFDKLFEDGLYPDGDELEEASLNTDHELQRAVNHCKRALYDAVEIDIIDRVEDIRDFKKLYRISDIMRLIPEFSKKYLEVEDTLEFLEKIDGQFHHKREKYSQILEEKSQPIRELHKLVLTYEGAVEEAHQEYIRTLNKERITLSWQRFGAIVAAVFGFITAVITGIGILIQLSKSPAPQQCMPGKVDVCPCADGNSGLQTCADDGASWDKCSCVPPIDIDTDNRSPERGKHSIPAIPDTQAIKGDDGTANVDSCTSFSSTDTRSENDTMGSASTQG